MRRSRVIYIDIIRVFAMLAVVLAHSCASTLSADPSTKYWIPANILVTITTLAVPLFYMISGATILNSIRTRKLSYLFKHRLPRILIPFLIWSLLSSIIFKLINNDLHIQSVVTSMLLLYHQPMLTAYWFLYPLIGFYLLSPAIKAFVDNVDGKTFNYILIVWFITNILLPNIARSLPPEYGQYFAVYSMGKLTFLSRMTGYFLLGYKLAHVESSSIKLRLHAGVFTIGLLVSIITTYIISIYALPDKPLENMLPPILLPIIVSSLFLIFKKLEGKYNRPVQQVTESIAPLTYGVYLSHGIVIELVQQVIDPLNYLGVFGISIIICLMFVWALNNVAFLQDYFI